MDGQLGRRLQLTHGLHWLGAAHGDPYAALLRGFGDDPSPAAERIRGQGPLWESRAGCWVTGHYAVAARLLGDPRLGPPSAAEQVIAFPGTLLEASPAELDRLRASTGPALVSAQAQRSGQRVVDSALAGVAGEFDVAASLLTPAPVSALAALFGLTGEHRQRLLRACVDASAALDAAVCAQRLDGALRLIRAVASLQALFSEAVTGRAGGGRTLGAGLAAGEIARLGVLLALAGVPAAMALTANALLAVLDQPDQWAELAGDPRYAGRVIAETARHSPPVRLVTLATSGGLDLAGRRVPAGSLVAVHIAAANRDPAVFAQPSRFDPGRPVDPQRPPLVAGHAHAVAAPFARLQAEQMLRTLAARFPRLKRSGRLLWRRRAPVTGQVLRFPVRTN